MRAKLARLRALARVARLAHRSWSRRRDVGPARSFLADRDNDRTVALVGGWKRFAVHP